MVVQQGIQEVPMINNLEECLEENEWVTKALPAPFLA